jgi:tricorn protease
MAGLSEPVPLTPAPPHGVARPMLLVARPSPNGMLVAYTDADATLRLLCCRDGRTHVVKRGRAGVGTAFEWNRPFDTLSWSADSEWLAFSLRASSSMSQVWVVHVSTPSDPICVSSERFHSWSPSFALDGPWLYFLSERELHHTQDVFGLRAEQPLLDRSVAVYAIPRDPLAHPPWRFANELQARDAAVHAKGGFAPAERSTPPPPSRFPGWGFEGGPAEAAQRVLHVPVPPSAFRRLECIAAGRLLLWNAKNDELCCVDVPRAALHGELAAKVLVQHTGRDFCVSPNGERVLLKRGSTLYIGACGFGGASAELKMELSEAQELRTEDLLVRTHPRNEWREIFADAWRQARDAFWDAQMGGVDWLGAFRTHAALLPRVGCRSELYDLIRRMYSELRVLHLFAHTCVTRIVPRVTRTHTTHASHLHCVALAPRLTYCARMCCPRE